MNDTLKVDYRAIIEMFCTAVLLFAYHQNHASKVWTYIKSAKHKIAREAADEEQNISFQTSLAIKRRQKRLL